MSLKRSAETHLTGPVAGLSGVALWCARPPWKSALAHPPGAGGVDNPSPWGAGPGGTFPPLPDPDAPPVDSSAAHRGLALPMSKAQGGYGGTRSGQGLVRAPGLFSREEGGWGAERPPPRVPRVGEGEGAAPRPKPASP